MVLKKKMQHRISTASNGKNGIQLFQDQKNITADHHSAFLDEMEAPMWVDLTLECKFAYEDKDDEWFNVSHPFHQLSSRELIATFSGSNEGCTKLAASSPKLPSSVSRSRGKHYKDREWRKEKNKDTLRKGHPVKYLSIKGSGANLGSDKARKDKSCCKIVKEHTGIISSSDKESSLTEVADVNCLNSVSNSGDLRNLAVSVASAIEDGHSTSTITSEGTLQQQQKSLELPGQLSGHATGLLSALRTTLRKSCVTRQASRYEVSRGRQSEGRKSSSSKSSVGSSSNPAYEGKYLTDRQSKDRTPESRNVTRISCTPNDKVWRHHRSHKVLVPHKVNACVSPSAAAKAKEVKEAACTSRFARAGKENEAGRITAVQKARSGHKIPTVSTEAKERTIAGHSSGILGGPKVNANQRLALSQKLSTLEKGAKGTVHAQNITKRRDLQKSGTEKLTAPKGKIGGRTEVKGYANVTRKVYLR